MTTSQSHKQFLVLDFDGTLGYSELTLRRADRRAAPAQESSVFQVDLEAEDEELHQQKPSGEDAELSMGRNGEPGRTLLYLRPHYEKFLQTVSKRYTLVLWSFGVKPYIQEILSKARLGGYFQGVITRDEMRAPVKDLYAITKDLTHIAIVDDSNTTFGLLNPLNCIDVPTWTPQVEGDTILKVLPDLIELHFERVLRQFTNEYLVGLRMTILDRLRNHEESLVQAEMGNT